MLSKSQSTKAMNIMSGTARKLGVAFVLWSLLLSHGLEAAVLDELPVDGSRDNFNAVTGIEKEKSELAVTSLDSLRQFSSHFERSATLRKLLAQADAARLVELLEESDEISLDSWKSEVQTALFSRLSELDPVRALENIDQVPWHRRESQVELVFASWAKADVESAIKHLDGLDDSFRQIATDSIVMNSNFENVNELLQLANKLDASSAGFMALTQYVALAGLNDPRDTWMTLIHDQTRDIAKVEALMSVAIAWMNKDGTEILAEIVSSLPDWPTRSFVVGAALAHKAQTNPQEAFELAVELREETHNGIFGGIVQEWAASDPVRALEKVSEELEDPMLLHQLQSSIINTWSDHNPKEVLENLEVFSKQLQMQARNRSMVSVAKADPREAANLTKSWSQIPNDVGHAIVSNWAIISPQEAYDWVLSTVEEFNQRKYLLAFVWQELVEIDAQSAFQAAVTIDTNSREPGLEVDVIRSLAKYDLEKAKSMLPLVREGNTREQAFGEVGVELVVRGKHLEALQLGEQLHETEKEGFLTILVARWAYIDPNELARVLDQIPSEEAQSSGAMWLTTANRSLHALSDQELEHIKQFLNETDASRLRH